MKKTSFLIALVAVVAVAASVAGCGGGKSNGGTSTPAPSTTPPPSGGAKGTNLKIAADPSGAFKFDTTSLSAKGGKVTIVMDNPSPVPHSIAIEGSGVDETGSGGTTGVEQGKTSTVAVNLKPGTYEFYCPVDGHRQAGMKGKLTVK